MNPKGIYGAETSQPTEARQRAYTTAIKSTVSNEVQHKNVDATFATSLYGQDLDPETCIYTNLATMLRRAISKKPNLKTISQAIINHYIEHDCVGTNCNHVRIGNCSPAPPLGNNGRQPWKPLFPPQGPIGLLLAQTHVKGAAINRNFQIITSGWPEVDILFIG